MCCYENVKGNVGVQSTSSRINERDTPRGRLGDLKVKVRGDFGKKRIERAQDRDCVSQS